MTERLVTVLISAATSAAVCLLAHWLTRRRSIEDARRRECLEYLKLISDTVERCTMSCTLYLTSSSPQPEKWQEIIYETKKVSGYLNGNRPIASKTADGILDLLVSWKGAMTSKGPRKAKSGKATDSDIARIEESKRLLDCRISEIRERVVRGCKLPP